MSNSSSTRWFQLREHVGVTADGNPEPLVTQSLNALVPTMVDGQVTETVEGLVIEPADRLGAVTARVVPGTRMIETGDPTVISLLLQLGHYDEITQPTKAEIQKAAKGLTDAKDEAGTHEPDPLEQPEQYAEGHAGDEKKGA